MQSDAGSCSESSGMTSGISGVGACVLLSLESTVRAALVGAAARPAMSGSLQRHLAVRNEFKSFSPS